jgi:hypothetical protein
MDLRTKSNTRERNRPTPFLPRAFTIKAMASGMPSGCGFLAPINSLLKKGCGVGQARFERRPTIWNQLETMVGRRGEAPLVPPYI